MNNLRSFPLLLSIGLLWGFGNLRLCGQTSDIRKLIPYPKNAFERSGEFLLNGNTVIVGYDTGGTGRGIEWLRKNLASRFGIAPSVVRPQDYNGTSPAILIGLLQSPHIAPHMQGMQPPGEPSPNLVGSDEIVREAYLLDISPERIIITAAEPEGIFYGTTSLIELTGSGTLPRRLRSCHILDYPDYPVRWAFSQHNLRGNGAMTTLEQILDSMSFSKMNGIQQSDFKYTILSEQPDYYFDSVVRFRGMSAARNIEIIPGVAPIGWSSGILWHDPNLAEGFPAEALYVVEADTARIIPDPRVDLPNGGFEKINEQGKSDGWNFYDEETITIDRSIYRSGSASARSGNFSAQPAGNSRFNRRVDCFPNRYYTMSAWVRTDALQCDEVRLLAIGQDDGGKSRTLTYTAFNVSGTSNGWKRLEARFNTLEFNHLLLYCGVWGGKSGTIWWDDWEIRDAELLNVLRRDGTPLHLYDASSGTERIEGTDFLPIADSMMLESRGEFGPYHTPPTIRITPESAIANGDTLRATWFHPLTTVADENVNGSVMVCVSEEKLYQVLREEIEGVHGLYQPENWFMGHDEIRSLNRDSSCLHSGMSAAELLAENVRRIASLIDSTAPGSRISVWSDMFDSLHNAHDDYYLINGDLTGGWNDIPKELTIVNWNSQWKKKSLDFFAGHGFSQIAAPFLPSANDASPREWRLAAQGVSGMRGMMYVTWSADYNPLRPFGYYAWGAGPYVIHRPYEIAELQSLMAGNDSIPFRAEVLADPYDGTDSIEKVEIEMEFEPSNVTLFDMTEGGNNGWEFYLQSYQLRDGIRYRIIATDSRGLIRETPYYHLRDGLSSVKEIPENVRQRRKMDLRGR